MMSGPSETVESGGAGSVLRPLVRDGWVPAARGAVLVAAVVAVLGQVVAFAGLLGGALAGASVSQTARYGWALFYVFHHVGMVVRTSDLRLFDGAAGVLAWPAGFAIDAVVAFAPLTATAFVAWALTRAGRSIGAAVGGPELRRAVHGAKVAVPYALLCWGAGWALRLRLTLPDSSPMSVYPSRLASFFWPLALAAMFGAIGGLRSAGAGVWRSDQLWASEARGRRWGGAVFGGLWMLGLGVGLSVVGLLILAAVDRSTAASYLRAAFGPGFGTGAMAVLTFVLFLPNIGAWILVPAMGGCLEVGGGTGSSLPSYCFLSYNSFVRDPLPNSYNPSWGYHQLGGPPTAFLLFLIVPAIAMVAGGVLAARWAASTRRAEGALVGGMAGLVFAASFTFVLVLSELTARLRGPITYVATGYYRYGPYPPYGLQLALAWGVIGGAVGGFLGARRLRARAP
jgi:hypothetical protein